MSSSEPFDVEGSCLAIMKQYIILAVRMNGVDVLRDLLDSPQFYIITDDFGNSLLHIAINFVNKEVFDYMLSLPDFPLDVANKEGDTPLVVSLCNYHYFVPRCLNEHFAYELLKKGASIDNVWFYEGSLLLNALKFSFIKVAKLLMEAGVDVNFPTSDGKSPLYLALMSEDKSEAVTALLMYGAESSVDLFRISVMQDLGCLVQESLFFYFYDEYSDVKIDLEVLLKLALNNSPVLNEIIKFSVEAEISKSNLYNCFYALCSMNVHYLNIVIEKFGTYVSELFSRIIDVCFYDNRGLGTSEYLGNEISVTNLNVLVESSMRSHVITIITYQHSGAFFNYLIDMGNTKSTIEELYCFMLSYGLTCTEYDLQLVYQTFGYCKLFKFLLHMDFDSFNPNFHIRGKRHIMATFIYDVSMNLEKFLSRPCLYKTRESMEELLCYFAHPKLREIYYDDYDDQTTPPLPEKNLPRTPRLEELARNAFRKFFIQKFEITTSKKFYTLLNCLPISQVYKKIITYETKLYSVDF